MAHRLVASFTGLTMRAYLLRPSIRARHLFRELETLQLGQSSFEDAERLARKIHAKPRGPCSRSACTWGVEVGNARLPRWWRGNGEVFAIAFSVKDSLIMRKYTGLALEQMRRSLPLMCRLKNRSIGDEGIHENRSRQVGTLRSCFAIIGSLCV
jgi:hypothetical protein